MKKLSVFLLAVILSLVAPMPADALDFIPTAATLREYADAVGALVNKERATHDLEPLQMVPMLNSFAWVRADECAESFSHTRPDGSSCFTILDGVDYIYAGENIAVGQETPAQVMASWMDSEMHRDNILSANYNYLGVGVGYVDDVFYWEQMFVECEGEITGAYTPVETDARTEGSQNHDAEGLIADEETPTHELGDINFDSVVDVSDGREILMYYAENAIAGTARTYASDVASLVNDERGDAGVRAVQSSPILDKLAAARAEECTETFSHTRPDGTDCFTILDGVITYQSAGENIAAGQRTPEAAMNDWMNSEGHRANILRDNYDYVGFGVYETDDDYGIYWVQIFVSSEEDLTALSLVGDVDGDGGVDVSDARAVLTMYAQRAVGEK